MTTQNNGSTATSKKTQINTSSVEHEIDEPIATQSITLPSTVVPSTVVPSTKTVEPSVYSTQIQYLWIEASNKVLLYQGCNVYIQQPTGSSMILLGRVTAKGIERNDQLNASAPLMALIDAGNRKWSPAAKIDADTKKLARQNQARLDLDSLFS